MIINETYLHFASKSLSKLTIGKALPYGSHYVRSWGAIFRPRIAFRDELLQFFLSIKKIFASKFLIFLGEIHFE